MCASIQVEGMWTGLQLCGPAAFLVLCGATNNIVLALCVTQHAARCFVSPLTLHAALVGTPCSASLESCRRCWAPGTSTSGGRWESRSPSVPSFASGTQRHAMPAPRHQLTLWWAHSFSVDYVVHLGHMYSECVHADRDSRVRHAAVTMGVTVVAGAATTLGAGLVMLLCQLTFFTKVLCADAHTVAATYLYGGVHCAHAVCWRGAHAQMALLITLTIAFSFLTALGPFLALCAAAGPEGRVGNIADMFGAVRQCLCRRPTTKSLHE